jgi:hypothetical protein
LAATLVVTLGATVALAGCNAGRVFVASPGDWAEYRRVRLAETLDERIAAAFEYLERRPDGMYAERVRRYFERVEPLYYKARQRSIAGLEAYLSALPRGPHAEDALGELVLRRGAARDRSLAERSVDALGRRLDAGREARREAADLLLAWVERLLTPALWRAPLADAPAELLLPWRLALPAPSCVPSDAPTTLRCDKPLVRRFGVVEDGEPRERELAATLVMDLDADGRPRRARLHGPEILLRTREAEEPRLVRGDEATARRLAALRFAERLTSVLFASELACEGTSEPTGAVVMQCEALVLRVMPGSTPDGEDEVLLEPSVAVPAAPARREDPYGD